MRNYLGICSDGDSVFSAKYKGCQPRLDMECIQALWTWCINHKLEIGTRNLKDCPLVLEVKKTCKLMKQFAKASYTRVEKLKEIAKEHGMEWKSMNIDYDEKWWPTIKNLLKAAIYNHKILVEYLHSDENMSREHEMKLWIVDDNPDIFKVKHKENVYRTDKDREKENLVGAVENGTIVQIERFNEEKTHALLAKPIKGWIKLKYGDKNKKVLCRNKKIEEDLKPENLLQRLLNPDITANLYDLMDIINIFSEHCCLPAMAKYCSIPSLLQEVETMERKLNQLRKKKDRLRNCGTNCMLSKRLVVFLNVQFSKHLVGI